MIVLDAPAAIKWFVRDEPLTAEAGPVLDAIELDPSPYSVSLEGMAIFREARGFCC